MSNDDRVLRELAKLGLVALYSEGAWYAAKPKVLQRVSLGYQTLAKLGAFTTNAFSLQNVVSLPLPLPSASSDD